MYIQLNSKYIYLFLQCVLLNLRYKKLACETNLQQNIKLSAKPHITLSAGIWVNIKNILVYSCWKRENYVFLKVCVPFCASFTILYCHYILFESKEAEKCFFLQLKLWNLKFSFILSYRPSSL